MQSHREKDMHRTSRHQYNQEHKTSTPERSILTFPQMILVSRDLRNLAAKLGEGHNDLNRAKR